jgi:hypothetical protein
LSCSLAVCSLAVGWILSFCKFRTIYFQ